MNTSTSFCVLGVGVESGDETARNSIGTMGCAVPASQHTCTTSDQARQQHPYHTHMPPPLELHNAIDEPSTTAGLTDGKHSCAHGGVGYCRELVNLTVAPTHGPSHERVA